MAQVESSYYEFTKRNAAVVIIAAQFLSFSYSLRKFSFFIMGSGEFFGGIGEVVSSPQGNFVCLGELRVLAKLAGDPG